MTVIDLLDMKKELDTIQERLHVIQEENSSESEEEKKGRKKNKKE